jgi:hypothetical protein
MKTNSTIGFVKESDSRQKEQFRVHMESLWYLATKDIGYNPSKQTVISEQEYEDDCRLLDNGREYE